MSKKIVIGIDIGGTYTKVGLVDDTGKVLIDTKFSSREHNNFNDYITQLKSNVDKLKQKVQYQGEIYGVGIGCPNCNYSTGVIENAPNLVWKGQLPIVKSVKNAFNIDNVVATNDANVAAIGEMYYGHAKGMKNFIVITLGTGLGAGVVIDGKLLYGHGYLAGELGHITIDTNGREAKTGKRGALETYVSSTALKRTIMYMLADSIAESRFRKIAFDDLHGEVITKAAHEGDEIATRAFEYTGEKLGVALANFVAFTHPEAIFLLGGLAKSGDLLIKPALKAMNEQILDIYKGQVTVSRSALESQNAAVLGAVALAFDEFKD